ncbi:uncharacterized protein EDB91DRAFT_1159973, partial [Suillus paluster]|uniref:uncharacterized protein n=1 Tax=Suillus paluster TaxID=48578 RepID=UPI001B872939
MQLILPTLSFLLVPVAVKCLSTRFPPRSHHRRKSREQQRTGFGDRPFMYRECGSLGKAVGCLYGCAHGSLRAQWTYRVTSTVVYFEALRAKKNHQCL